MLDLGYSTILADFEAKIDGKVVSTSVQPKEEAHEIYDDAVASGKAAIMAETSISDTSLSISLGNLPADQIAILKLQLVSEAIVSQGHYDHSIPLAFLPDQRKSCCNNVLGPVQFEWNAKILSDGPIARIYAPTDAQIEQLTEERTQYMVKMEKVNADMKIMYRTPDIMKPSVVCAKQEGSDQVAIMASLVPSSEVLQSEETQIEFGERPVQPRRRKTGS